MSPLLSYFHVLVSIDRHVKVVTQGIVNMLPVISAIIQGTDQKHKVARLQFAVFCAFLKCLLMAQDVGCRRSFIAKDIPELRKRRTEMLQVAQTALHMNHRYVSGCVANIRVLIVVQLKPYAFVMFALCMNYAILRAQTDTPYNGFVDITAQGGEASMAFLRGRMRHSNCSSGTTQHSGCTFLCYTLNRVLLLHLSRQSVHHDVHANPQTCTRCGDTQISESNSKSTASRVRCKSRGSV